MNTDDEKYNGKTWEEWDETQYNCPQEGCGHETSHVEEGYFQCRCGWFGQPITIIDDLRADNERLTARLRDAEDMIENCGYCRDCFWNSESIRDTIANDNITEPTWPDTYTSLCTSCLEDFKEMIR